METSVLDLAPITRHLRAMAGSRILIAAVHHLKVFEILNNNPLTKAELQQKIGLKERPAMVLFPALCAMNMLKVNADGHFMLTDLGTYLTTTYPTNLIGYVGLEKDDPGVLTLSQYLLNDGPDDSFKGVSYVKDEAAPSPMDNPEEARFFTLALAGRARYLAPVVAAHLPKREGHLLDVACGTGYYTYEWLLKNQKATATLFDRPEVLKIAQEVLNDFCQQNSEKAGNLKERITFLAGDMLTDELPKTDLLLAASLFHDWPTDICQFLKHIFRQAHNPGGELCVHDAFLNDSLNGPLAVTDYSIMLFLGTKGRAYSRKEFRNWFMQAGLTPTPDNIPTLLDYGLISAIKPV